MDDANLIKNLSVLVLYLQLFKCHFKLLEKASQESKITPLEQFRFNVGYSEKRKKLALPFIFAEEIFKRGTVSP
jgi:hypothetical protein